MSHGSVIYRRRNERISVIQLISVKAHTYVSAVRHLKGDRTKRRIGSRHAFSHDDDSVCTLVFARDRLFGGNTLSLVCGAYVGKVVRRIKIQRSEGEARARFERHRIGHGITERNLASVWHT